LLGNATPARLKHCALVVGTNIVMLFGAHLGQVTPGSRVGRYYYAPTMQATQTYCDNVVMIDGNIFFFIQLLFA